MCASAEDIRWANVLQLNTTVPLLNRHHVKNERCASLMRACCSGPDSWKMEKIDRKSESKCVQMFMVSAWSQNIEPM